MTRFIQAIFILGIAVFAACTPKSAKYFAKAEVQFKQAEYQHAIENYQQALSEGYDAGQANYYIAESYRRSNRIQEAEPFYRKAIEAGVKDEEAHFFYGNALKSVGNYEGAATQYKEYIKNGSNFDYINRAKRELENLKALQKIVEMEQSYVIDNIEQLNTEHAEYAPFFYKGKLYFTTARDAEKMHAATGTGFTDIYEFNFDGVEKFSGQAQPVDNIINTDGAHEASAILTKDGKTIIFARGNNGAKKGPKDVDLFKSVRQSDGSWSEPVMLAISDPLAWDACPALSLDEKTLYFASNREGGSGNVDIYKATLDANGQWANVENVGAPINTSGNDMYPTISEKGTFYFSSDGHPSLGSLDIFYIKKPVGNAKPTIENIGKPINSSYDDFGIVWKDSLDGYFASNRPDMGAKGDDDIYNIRDTYWDRTATYFVDGTSFGTSKKNPKYVLAGTNVYLLDSIGQPVDTAIADSKGKYSFEVKSGKKYFLSAHKEGYFTQTREDWVPATIATVPIQKLKKGANVIRDTVDVSLLVKKEEIIIVRNILYDYNKWDIRPDAAKELDVIVELMKNNPEVRIELGSHTDERGSADYNRALSKKRAQSAVDYIVAHGIATDRIIAKGYGEDSPAIKGASTEDQHQTNRRTTFKVLNHYSDTLEIQTAE